MVPDYRFIGILCILIAGFTPAAQAADWRNCASDIEILMRAANDALYEVQQVESSEAVLDHKKEELDYCLYFSNAHDQRREQCKSLLNDYHLAHKTYKYDLINLEGELNHVLGRLRALQASCDFSLSSGDMKGTVQFPEKGYPDTDRLMDASGQPPARAGLPPSRNMPPASFKTE